MLRLIAELKHASALKLKLVSAQTELNCEYAALRIRRRILITSDFLRRSKRLFLKALMPLGKGLRTASR